MTEDEKMIKIRERFPEIFQTEKNCFLLKFLNLCNNMINLYLKNCLRQ